MESMKKRDPFKTEQLPMIKNSKLVGGYVPLPLADHLRLISVYKSKSLQNMFQEIIEKHCRESKSEKEIIEILVEKAVMEWQRRIMESGKISKIEQEKYMREIYSILKRRKVAERHINVILSKLKYKVGSIG